MYESYTRQSLPDKEYRELLGSALCVFNSNNAFVIENILHTDSLSYNWYELMDKESGRLKNYINKIIGLYDNAVADKFLNIVEMRNRIIHSYQVTHNGEQVLATKTKVKDGNSQFIITKQYLLDFIKANQKLCDMLYKYRKKITTTD